MPRTPRWPRSWRPHRPSRHPAESTGSAASTATTPRIRRAAGPRGPAARSVSDLEPRLGGAHLVGARALGALLDLEGDGLAADQTVEVERAVERAAMEEI